jgi:adenylate cyclase
VPHKYEQTAFLMNAEVHVNVPVKKMWSWISDTNHQSRTVGFAPITYEENPLKPGKIRKLIRTGLGPDEELYEEAPFEWIHETFYSFERKYHTGLFKYLKFKTTIENKSDFGFDLMYMWEVVARDDSQIPMIKEVLREITNQALDRVKQFEWKLASDPSQPASQPALGQEDLEKSIRLLERFNQFSPNRALNEAFILYVLGSPADEVTRMRPYQVAGRLGESRERMLEVMLRATKQGLLEMKWEVLCPTCRGGKSSVSALWDMELQAHCPSCNIQYDAEFDRNVELVFYPHDAFRQIHHAVYCISSPTRTPHILIQLDIRRNESVRVPFHFRQEGEYRIYSPVSDRVLNIRVQNEPYFPTVIAYGTDQTNSQIVVSLGEHELILSNDSVDEDQIVRLEKTEWFDDITTAGEVTAMPEFRKLFSSEVLRPGVEMGIKNLTVLFTDLKDSTLFYNEIGDAAAFGVVKDHFDVLSQVVEQHHGAVVKTIGDAIMAVFAHPGDAIASAIDIQQSIKILNARLPEHKQIIVKSGIHDGHVLAVNLNNHLDYFGHTVNLAARTNSISHGQDIVITDAMYQIPEVKQCLEVREVKVTHFTSEIKGFPDQYRLHRIIL